MYSEKKRILAVSITLPHTRSRLSSTLRFYGDHGPFVAAFTTLSAIFGCIATIYLHKFPITLAAAAGIFGCFLLLLFLALLPGFATVGTAKTPYIPLALLCAAYLIYAAGTGDFRPGAFGRLVTVAAVPLLFYRFFPVRRLNSFQWQDGCVAILLIGVVLSSTLRGIWAVPKNLDFLTRLFLMAVASWCWTFVRPVPHLGYRFRISRPVLQAAAVNFLWFALIAIPAGLLIHFTGWNPRWHGIPSFLIDYLEIFLFIALLEEMFFRGFLQSLLTDSFGSWWKAQLAVSVLFGLFHILHAPFPNWRYVALATIAGWFYGSAYRTTGSLMASALTHAMVDTVWRTWFTRLLP